jgi:cytochrome c oxidase cbb3-type subunit 1
MMAVRVLNEPFHFTHHTIGHAHLGLYAFYTMVMFGAVYYIMPRLTGREFFSRKLIHTHFWCSAIGISMMFLVLTVGGIIQGHEWNQAGRSLSDCIRDNGLIGGGIAWFDSFKTQQDQPVAFMTALRETIPWLVHRSLSGALILIGHTAFAILVFWNLFGTGVQRARTVLFPLRSATNEKTTHEEGLK